MGMERKKNKNSGKGQEQSQEYQSPLSPPPLLSLQTNKQKKANNK